MRRSIIGCGIMALFMASACGTEAKYKVDSAKLAHLPQSERGELIARQGERDRADGDMEKARAAVDTAEHSIATAQAEAEQAHSESLRLASKIYLTRPLQGAARLVQLEAARDITKLAENAAETRLRWSKQQREVGRAQMTAAAAQSRLVETRIEQAQAHLAARHGIVPSRNFNIAVFDQQVRWAERDDDRQRRNVLAETAQSAAIEREYAQQLSLYSQRRKQTPSFSSSYTPPGYPPAAEHDWSQP